MNPAANSSTLQHCAQCGDSVQPGDHVEFTDYTRQIVLGDFRSQQVCLHTHECLDAYRVIKHTKDQHAGRWISDPNVPGTVFTLDTTMFTVKL